MHFRCSSQWNNVLRIYFWSVFLRLSLSSLQIFFSSFSSSIEKKLKTNIERKWRYETNKVAISLASLWFIYSFNFSRVFVLLFPLSLSFSFRCLLIETIIFLWSQGYIRKQTQKCAIDICTFRFLISSNENILCQT